MNVCNGLLAAAVAAGVLFSGTPFADQDVVSLPPAKEESSWSGERTEPYQSSSHVDYAVISEQNLFHPERKIPPDKQQDKAVPKPDLFLYGTLITDDISIAFVEDKKALYSTAGRGKRQMTLKKGTNLRGYIVSEIEPNRIVLIKDEDRLVVMLDDSQKKRTVEQAAASPAASRTMPGVTSHTQPAENQSFQTTPASEQTVIVKSPVISASGTQPLPRAAQDLPRVAPTAPKSAPALPAFTQTEQSSPGPGIGGSGTWPPTKSSVDLTRQKISDGRQMRLNQMQGGQ